MVDIKPWQAQATPNIDSSSLHSIIVDGDATKLVAEADSFGTALYKTGLTKSQIRSIFGTVRQIQATWDNDPNQVRLRKVLLLKPRLAYQSTRNRQTKPLADTLAEAIDMVVETVDVRQQTDRFNHFVDLFEAILAYHTAAGGK